MSSRSSYNHQHDCLVWILLAEAMASVHQPYLSGTAPQPPTATASRLMDNQLNRLRFCLMQEERRHMSKNKRARKQYHFKYYFPLSCHLISDGDARAFLLPLSAFADNGRINNVGRKMRMIIAILPTRESQKLHSCKHALLLEF